MSNRIWIIISAQTQTALYGANRAVLKFSTEAIAIEVAIQMLEKGDEFIIFNTAQLN